MDAGKSIDAQSFVYSITHNSFLLFLSPFLTLSPILSFSLLTENEQSEKVYNTLSAFCLMRAHFVKHVQIVYETTLYSGLMGNSLCIIAFFKLEETQCPDPV